MDQMESEQPKFRRRGIIAAVLLIILVGGSVAIGTIGLVKVEYLLMAGTLGAFLLLAYLIQNLVQLANARRADTLRELGFEILPGISSFWRGRTITLPVEIETLFRAATGVGTAGRVYFAAIRSSESSECWFIRHMIQHGKSTTTRNIALIPRPTRWPIAKIHRKGIADVFRRIMGEKKVLLGNSVFDEKIAVTCRDAEFATLLIGPELQQIALSLTLGEEIAIGGGGICAISLAMMGDKELRRLLGVAEKVYATIPPELAEWEPREPASLRQT